MLLHPKENARAEYAAPPSLFNLERDYLAEAAGLILRNKKASRSSLRVIITNVNMDASGRLSSHRSPQNIQDSSLFRERKDEMKPPYEVDFPEGYRQAPHSQEP